MTKQNNSPTLRFPEFKEEWEYKKLGEITTKISDGLHSTPNYDEVGDYFFINGNNLINGSIVINETTKRVSYDEYLKHKKDLDDSTILLSINGTIGSLALYRNEKIILGKSACYINLNNQTYKNYIYNLLQTSTIINFFISELTGTTIKNLSLTTIKKCSIHLPTLPEQTKIATFLTAVDERLTQLKQKKTLLEQYKKGVMQKIFDQEIRFKPSLIGVEGDDSGNKFPEWEVKKLGEIGIFIGGGTPSTKNSDFWSGNLPWISSSDLSEDNIYQINKTRFITNEAVKITATKIVPKDSVLIVSRVGVGKVAVNKEEICTSQDFTSLVSHNQNAIFLAYLIKLKTNKLLEFNQGTSIKGFVKSDLETLEIHLPCLAEQTKIANFLSVLDEKINGCSTQIAKTEAYKKGLLQQMFV